MIDFNGEGYLDLNNMRQVLQDQLYAGESGNSIGEEGQVWLHIMEELEKDGDRPINYSDFYDAILIVIQRNLAEQIQIVTKREKGLRQSIILQ